MHSFELPVSGRRVEREKLKSLIAATDATRSYDDRAHELCVINQLYVYIWKLYIGNLNKYGKLFHSILSITFFSVNYYNSTNYVLIGDFSVLEIHSEINFCEFVWKGMWMAKKTNIICLNSWGHELGECWQSERERMYRGKKRGDVIKTFKSPYVFLHHLMCKHYFLYRMKMFPTNLVPSLSPHHQNEYISQWMSEEIKPKIFHEPQYLKKCGEKFPEELRLMRSWQSLSSSGSLLHALYYYIRPST